MSRINAYFMEKLETDSDFRRDVELAEAAFSEPDFPSDNDQALEAWEPLERGERLAA